MGVKALGLDSVIAPAPTVPDVEPESLIIKEARRRQRRRYLVTALGVVVLLVGVSVIVTRLSGARPAKSKTQPSDSTARPPLAVNGTDSSLLMWPVGPAVFTQDAGPPAYLDNLQTGSLDQIKFDISAGDYQPLVTTTGQWLVYVGDGVEAVRDDLRGPARILGSTPFFAPSATPDSVWLESNLSGIVRVHEVKVSGGPPGPAFTLPDGSRLVEGTDAGFLLTGGTLDGIELWKPGGSPRTLPYSPSFNDGFAASPILIAYGSDCFNGVASSSSNEPNAGYEMCRVMRVFDVVTRTLSSFSTPPGTAGWVPNGFGLVDAIAPGNAMIAGEAATLPTGSGRVRLYLLRLNGRERGPTAVPSSTSSLYARTAWSPDGSWLLYQGTTGHLSEFNATTGAVRSSRTPCCQYTVMVALPSP
jgi:hypothetical protein